MASLHCSAGSGERRGFFDSLTLTDMKDKAGAEKLRGKSILEISELNGLKTAEVETIKAFLSTQKDGYWPPYDKQAQDFLRSCHSWSSNQQ